MVYITQIGKRKTETPQRFAVSAAGGAARGGRRPFGQICHA